MVPAQVENVPVNNQVYEFLNRMGVKGVLPLYSNTMIPLSRQSVADLLHEVSSQSERLSEAEQGFLSKFRAEFAHELRLPEKSVSGLFNGDPLSDMFSGKEKYLFHYSDSTASLFLEFIGSLEYRQANTGSDNLHITFENHGFRARGTVKEKLGYYIQATNGTLWGDREYALTDKRLRGNVKFKDLDSPYFDFTEAYLRADLSWFNAQFGREYTLVGTGYSDRLLLSDNAPLFDFLKIDAQHKSLKFMFLHGSLLGDSEIFAGIPITEPMYSNKYLAMHRLEFTAFDGLRVGATEMVVYQRLSPEFGYLNPVNFYKSAEHSLRDRDNAVLSFDAEIFPAENYKLYGTWFIDDIDFSKMGTGWWGNEFAWQGGLYVAGFGGLENLDAVIEYTRIEPYVYSNRLHGNDITHNNIALGHDLDPNSDEWFGQLSYRPDKSLRTWCTVRRMRHGENIVAGGDVIKNVGGNPLQGHRDTDGTTALFLDGNLVRSTSVQLRASYEPINNLIISGAYEYQRISYATQSITTDIQAALLRLQLEY
jgi:hypothetical protein